jgi:hypothetical protein
MVTPVGSSPSPGNIPEITSVAKSFEAELNSLISLLHTLKTPVEPQLHNVAQHIKTAHEMAQKALSVGR